MRFEENITTTWQRKTDPLVSVICATYNHENYIREAIEGFLLQITEFPFEVIIHDDASTDTTTSIVQEYAEKYPKIIRTIFQKVNQFSKGQKTVPTVLPYARGKYIALCEGDDYWVDPYKLQKQLDFLENNKDYVICYHDTIVIDEAGNLVSDTQLPNNLKKDFTSDELMKAAWILTPSMCFRNVLDEIPEEYFKVLNSDRFLVVLLGPHGKGKYMGDSIRPAAYRIHDSSIWSCLGNDAQTFHNFNSALHIYQYYIRTGKKDFAIEFLFERVFKDLVLFYLEKNPNRNCICNIEKSNSYRIGKVITFIPRKLINWIKKTKEYIRFSGSFKKSKI